jgi:hypothetical protein
MNNQLPAKTTTGFDSKAVIPHRANGKTIISVELLDYSISTEPLEWRLTDEQNEYIEKYLNHRTL